MQLLTITRFIGWELHHYQTYWVELKMSPLIHLLDLKMLMSFFKQTNQNNDD